ncbi:MAG: VOC family protein [Cytophagales bacterium]
MKLKLDHYSIYSFKLEESIKFYSEVLGLKTLPRPEFNFPGHWFEIGNGQELHIISGRTQNISDLPQTRNIHYAFDCDDIASFEIHLKKFNLPTIGPKTRPDGIVQIFIQDPDGYWIEITATNK